MDSQLTRDINPNKYVTTIRSGLIGLALRTRPGLCELWISYHSDCRKHWEFLDTAVVQNLLSHTHTRHVPLWKMWATIKTLSKYLTVKNFQNAWLSFHFSYGLCFDDIIFLSSMGFAKKFAYVHNFFHIQFVSKHLTWCIHHCFTGMTIGT